MVEKDIYVTKASLPDYDAYIQAIKPLWESHMLTNMGSYHQKLASKLQAYLGVKGVALFSNGHMALELTLQAMQLQGEVITTPFTFVSTTHAITRNQLTPVFCDIHPKNYTIDVSKIEDLITDKTCAIVPVHVYGNLCDVQEIDRIAKKHHLKVIYDAAHAFGITKDGVGVGNFGDASVFSFHATKAFHTIEGGGVATSDRQLLDKLYALRNFGIKSEGLIEEVGANAKMNEFEAIMGLLNLGCFETNVRKRKAIVELYRNLLSDIPGLQFIQEDTRHQVGSNYTYFPIVIEEKEFGHTRDELVELLKQHHIYPRRYFYPLTSALACYKGIYNPKQTPVALHISKRVMTLPLYPELAFSDVERICDLIKKAVG